MSVIYFIFVLGLIVFVHELGHLIVAKAFNIYCKEFSLGFGPVVWSKQKSETQYSIRAIPLGGFVAMAGESEHSIDVDIPFERTIKGVHPFKRILVMLAGIAFNFLLAIVIFTGLVLSQGGINTPPDAIVDRVVENSPAQSVGLQKDDRIISISLPDGSLFTPTDFYDVINITQIIGDTMTFNIQRNNQMIAIEITPEYDAANQRYYLGLFVPPANFKPVPWFQAPWYGFDAFITSFLQVIASLGLLVRGIGLNQVSGPVGIFNITAQSAQAGVRSLFALIAILSVNIAVFNLLPLPILDGGRVIITGIEWIIRKPLPEKIEHNLMGISLFLMLALFVLVTFQDIWRLIFS
ncbi:MAG: site-2 protease family protein [Erysipelotrichia bacterium]|jgi:regulator of sigma E protease|nr:site-2 protease family protein [Erysipelotrichia bacterium]